MDTTAVPATDTRAAEPDSSSQALTGCAAAGLALLLPIVFVAWFLVLAGERGSRCLTYGEGCSPVPGDVLWAVFYVALGCGIVALTWPRAQWKPARLGVVVVQWAAQLLLAVLILIGA
ncbi:hypothetical protein [Streptomyces sp. DH24]|uniref:hypothetical protein n=1 Tax=Streptomyces sp. DH24 TaxID=3040123 RepID=UPI002442E63E|nr:hypothetical protein [Streptomyces sp. DH24]MDG9720680.1 hypothetical protein [Streptomyces sp. DH24]